jgi:serine/threonine protein kinase
VVGYEMLTGQRPFDAGTIVATALAHINQPPPQLPETVPGRVADLISACLAKCPADRPTSAAAVAHALGMADAAFVPAAPAGPAPAPAPTLPARTEVMSAQAMPTQAMPTQAMPTQAMPTRPSGLPDRRSRRHPAWLLGAATVVVLGVLAVFALSGGSDSSGKTPAVTATTSPGLTPSSSATAVIAPPAIATTRPGRLDKGRGNSHDHDHQKDGMQ